MSGFLSTIFSKAGAGLVSEIGTVIDGLHTSDEERAKVEAAVLAATQKYQLAMENAVTEREKEITERHKNDMQSDSWWSKNIRPLSLVFTLCSTVFLIFLTVFSELTKGQIEVLDKWIPLLQLVLGAQITFYFAARAGEKISKIVANRKANAER